jgi:CubicO group peptidase (beta-lactamase class C family)
MKKKKVLWGVFILLFLVLISGCIYLNSLLPIITGYAAKNLCSDVFVSGRNARDVEAIDLNFSFIKHTKNKVDQSEKRVTSRYLWRRSTAIYREGFGATLVRDVPEGVLRKAIYPVDTNPGYRQDTTAWPLGDVFHDTVTAGIDRQALGEISKKLINDNAYKGYPFAFLVIYKGIPIAEAYKPQFNQNTRFLSWSMAKSFTNAIVGVLVREGKVDIMKPAGIEEWKGDERCKITMNDLMQMQSGLKWNEDYGSRSDVNIMLFCKGDMSKYAISRPLEFPSGTHWYYSSGSDNIVSYLIREQFESDTSCYAFVRDKFFEKIGITDAVFEVDPSGDFVGSSYLYATARDYGRFGLLYLNDGVFNGERVLPEGWVKYTTTPATDSKGKYGSSFWLNKSGTYPSAPTEMYSCEGHDGQIIFILPSRQMVIVILGFSHGPVNNMDLDRLLKDILGTLTTGK